MTKLAENNPQGTANIADDRVFGAVYYSKITLCPSLKYKCFCQAPGRCEHCSYFHTRENEYCKGCGANFKDESLNIKAKYEKTKD